MFKQSEKRLFYIKLFVIALIIFGARLWLIHHFGSSVPFWDQWGAQANRLFLPWFNGTLTFNDVFSTHNEHRIVFTRLLSLLLLFLNERQWDPLLGMVVNALLSTFTAVLLIIMLNNLLGQAVQNIILVIVTLLWSLPYAWENILLSFNSQYYLMLFFTLIALWGLIHDSFSLRWWIGVICTLFALFTVASGFFILPVLIVIQLYLIIIDVDKRRSHLPTLLVSLALTSLALILIVRVPHHEVLIANNMGDFIQTFGKALAWPWVFHPWLSLVLYMPFLVFVFRMLWRHRKPSQAELFVLALGGWVILQAISMAYARGIGGRTPISRYMDILAFGIIVNLLAFHFIAQTGYGLHRWIKRHLIILVYVWKLLVIVGIGALIVMSAWPDMQQRGLQYAEQLKNTREFIRTGELSVLQNKPRLHIPYPDPKILAQLLAKPQLRAILPHSLTVPTLLQFYQNDSTFVNDGFYPNTEKYPNETTLGSYNHLGDRATGRFESIPIKLNHSFVEIPVAGHLGRKDLTLQLVVEGQAEPIVITPPRIAGKNWVSCYVRTPNQPFKLVAIDNRPDLWFAFAMPRSLGSLSFLTIWILERGWMVLLLGISLLFIIIFPPQLIMSSDISLICDGSNRVCK